jgi:hypothetical protein
VSKSEKWDKMTPGQRAKFLRGTDATMRRPEYADLVKRMSESTFGRLTLLQQDMLSDTL